jgi:predicted alpha/beta-hydrolase family hydrolase
MTSNAQARRPLAEVAALVFLGFPLHPPKQPGVGRADHLDRVELPMLFLQGTRDELARLDLLRPVCQRLGDRATLHIVEGGDHGFDVLKRSGRTDADVMQELATTVADWCHARVGAARA